MPGDLLIRVAALVVVLLAAAAFAYFVARDDESVVVAEFRVTRVVDGDTIELHNGEVVRLVQIDAPEMGEGECYAAESLVFLDAMIGGRTVRLVADPAVRVADEDRADRFGRSLRYVFVGRRNVNLELVRKGAAAPWFFDGVRGRYASRLLAAARDARARGDGLWDACPRARLNPLAPLDTG